MKIIFVVANMVGGGTERVISLIANYLSNTGNEIQLLLTAGNKIEYSLKPEIEIISLGDVTSGKLVKRVKRLHNMRSYFKKNRQAIICSFGVETNLFAVLSSLGLKNKLLISERNDPNKCNYKKLRNIIYHFADGLICQTEDAVKCFPLNIQKKTNVIVNPINPQLPEVYMGERKKEICAVGRLTLQKNYKLLLSSFAIFHKNNSEYILKIFGKGELEEELKREAVKLKIQDSVIFMGFVKEVEKHIRECSLYVLSSDYEGMSNSLMEAMGMGLPVISTDCPIGGSRMCIENGVNGFLVPLNDAEEMAQTMRIILENKSLSLRISQQASFVKNKFSVENICKQWLDVIDSI